MKIWHSWGSQQHGKKTGRGNDGLSNTWWVRTFFAQKSCLGSWKWNRGTGNYPLEEIECQQVWLLPPVYFFRIAPNTKLETLPLFAGCSHSRLLVEHLLDFLGWCQHLPQKKSIRTDGFCGIFSKEPCNWHQCLRSQVERSFIWHPNIGTWNLHVEPLDYVNSCSFNVSQKKLSYIYIFLIIIFILLRVSMPKNEAHTKHKGSNILNRIFLSFTTLGNMSFFNWSCKAGQGPKNDMPSEKKPLSYNVYGARKRDCFRDTPSEVVTLAFHGLVYLVNEPLTTLLKFNIL